MIKRRKTGTVKIGSVKIGQRHPISIQSMAKTHTENVSAAVRQIKALDTAGCEIVRVAVKNERCVLALDKIRKRINIPLVADIHFNYRLALKAIDCGVDGLRLNPGNIYRREEVREVAKAAGKRNIPIRVGVNSGSLRTPNKLGNYNICSLPIYRQKTEKLADLMVKSALDYVKLLESFDFYDIIISLKASSVAETVSAYRKMAGLCAYPFHLGITAGGLPADGTIKSAIGIGALLLEGIGDTIRVSLTASPQEEVRIAKQILQSLGLRYFYPEVIACPTCGRCRIDVVKITRQVKSKLQAPSSKLQAKCPVTIAIMGCEVNGPGEARDADVGIAGGKNCAVLFKKGKVVRRVREGEIVDTLVTVIASIAAQSQGRDCFVANKEIKGLLAMTGKRSEECSGQRV